MTLRKTFIFFAAFLAAFFCRAENVAVAGGSEFSQERAAKILTEKTARLESVSKKIAAARARIEELESALAARADSDSASRFYDAQAAELSAETGLDVLLVWNSGVPSELETMPYELTENGARLYRATGQLAQTILDGYIAAAYSPDDVFSDLPEKQAACVLVLP